MKLTVNGLEVDVDDRHADTPLLWVLREVLGMRGTKFGCGAGFCAACTVLIDGRNVKSCQTATAGAVGKTVTTVEGASGPVINAVRDAWHRRNVVQCGYCQPGQTLAAVSLLEDVYEYAGSPAELRAKSTYLELVGNKASRRLRASLNDFVNGSDAGEKSDRLSALWHAVTPIWQANGKIPPVIWWNNLERIFLAIDDLGCREFGTRCRPIGTLTPD